MPVYIPAPDQCTYVQENCSTSNTFVHINYLRRYFCADLPIRPLVFTGLVIWLMFLFSTLGISASDFFTPNLATIAQVLRLDENVAGVTFLAFGNGSPVSTGTSEARINVLIKPPRMFFRRFLPCVPIQAASPLVSFLERRHS